MRDSPRGFLERLVCGFDDSGLEISDSLSLPSIAQPQSICSGSSMAHMQPRPILHQSHRSTASNRPPSLLSCHTQDTVTDSSVGTSAADQLPGFPVLEDHDGVLELPLNEANSPTFECLFWFLDCPYISRNRQEWIVHCLHHFHGHEPPRSVSCPLCPWEASHDQGLAAWTLKMEHTANEHFQFGQNLSASRPDFQLFNYLWRKRLINDQDMKELSGGNHNLTHAPSNFVTDEGPRFRRERGPVRHPMQHVGQRRS